MINNITARALPASPLSGITAFLTKKPIIPSSVKHSYFTIAVFPKDKPTFAQATAKKKKFKHPCLKRYCVSLYRNPERIADIFKHWKVFSFVLADEPRKFIL